MKKNIENKQKKARCRHEGLQIPVYSKLTAFQNPSNDLQNQKAMDQNDANLHDTSPLVSQGNNPSETS